MLQSGDTITIPEHPRPIRIDAIEGGEAYLSTGCVVDVHRLEHRIATGEFTKEAR